MGDKYSVLIVEDDPGSAYLLRAMLASSLQYGFHYLFRIEIISRLSLAVARVQAENHVDIILLDLRLKTQTGHTVGLEALEKLRAVTNAPIIVVTGSIEWDDAQRILEEGAQGVYLKPLKIEPDAFIHEVWSAIHRNKYVKPVPAEAKPVHRLTLAAIVAGAATILTALIEVIKAWKAK